MNAAELSTTELAVRAHITFRQVDHWTRTGVLKAVQQRSSRSGVPRRFSPSEVDVARAVGFVSAAVTAQFQHDLFNQVAAAAREGRHSIVLPNGVTITWPERRNAPALRE